MDIISVQINGHNLCANVFSESFFSFSFPHRKLRVLMKKTSPKRHLVVPLPSYGERSKRGHGVGRRYLETNRMAWPTGVV